MTLIKQVLQHLHVKSWSNATNISKNNAQQSLQMFNELLVAFGHSDKHFIEYFAMKRRQHRSKQMTYVDSHGLAGFMRKIGMEHGSDKN